MKKYSQKIILERFELLPDELKSALFDSKISESISDISFSKNFSNEKTKSISLLVSYVFLGFIYFREFAEVLKEDLKIDSLIAQSIANELDREIFLPLRDKLKATYKKIEEIKEEDIGERKEEVVMPVGKEIKKKEPVLAKGETEMKKKIFPQSLKYEKKDIPSSMDFKPGVIRGKNDVVKPTLETSEPIGVGFSFGDVGKKREKVVSNLEVKKSFVEKIKPTPKDRKKEKNNGIFNNLLDNIKKKINKKEKGEIVSSKSPAKIVNFPLKEEKIISGNEKNIKEIKENIIISKKEDKNDNRDIDFKNIKF